MPLLKYFSKEDYDQLTTLAKEGISGRSEISRLKEKVSYYQERYYSLQNAYDALVEKYNHLIEICQPFLDALKHFPELVQKFIEKVKERFTATEKATETKNKNPNKERVLAPAVAVIKGRMLKTSRPVTTHS